MATKKNNSNNVNNATITVAACEVTISGRARHYVAWRKSYYWGINPWDDSTTKVFQIGGQWFEYSSYGNYTSQGRSLRQVAPEEAAATVEQLRKNFAMTGDDDGRNTYSLTEEAEKEISLTLDIKDVKVEHGHIAQVLREERQWRATHVVCDESVVSQILEAVGGRYEFVKDAPKGIHNAIVQAADGKVYSVDVVRRSGMGEWIYDAKVVPFDLAAEMAARKEFGRKVAALSKITDVPFGIVKILKEEQLNSPEVERMLHLLRLVHDLPKSEEEQHELCCGISRRTAEMARLLPEEVYNFFHVDCLGQSRNWTLAGYVAGGC